MTGVPLDVCLVGYDPVPPNSLNLAGSVSVVTTGVAGAVAIGGPLASPLVVTARASVLVAAMTLTKCQ